MRTPPDPSIWAAIFASSGSMECSQSGNPSSLLPFLKLLCFHDMKVPQSLSLEISEKPTSPGGGDWVCSLLNMRSQLLCNVINLNLANLGLTGLGIRDLSKCSKSLLHLRALDLKSNYLSIASGASFVADFIDHSSNAFSVLDISYNGLNTHDINLIKIAVECRMTGHLRLVADENIYHEDWRVFAIHEYDDKYRVDKVKSGFHSFTLVVLGNYPYIELWNAISHGIGVLLSIMGIIDLFYISRDLSTLIRLSCFVYGLSALILFVASTLYHSFFLLTTAKKVFKIVDHCAVFILIAGSYTPICAILYTARSDLVVST